MRGLAWRNFDFLLLGAVVLASAFGAMMIRSAVAGNEGLAGYDTRQAYFAAAGTIVIVLLASIDYRYWLAVHWPIYVVMMLFLMSLSGLGQAAFGAQRWFQVGVLFVQPTEFAKIVVILALSRHFHRSQHDARDMKWLLKSLAWVWGLVIWILLQPNLSNVIVTMFIWASMVWMNGVPLRQIAWLALAGVAIAVVAFPFLEPYQQARVINFALPDPQARTGATYNVLQALIAIGSGGLFGEGRFKGKQTQLEFVPDQETDLIFTAVGEEQGFVGCVVVLGLFVVLLWRTLHIAQNAKDNVGRLIAVGIGALVTVHVVVNVGMTIGLMPVKGMPLPFLSYGGSNLVTNMICIGLLENIHMRRHKIAF